MSEKFDTTNLYEGLFLMSQSAVGAGIGASIDHIRDILEKIGAEIITLRKWDERKLAYPIRGQKRGLYLFSLFRADGTKLAEAERSCNLSEQVVRVMFTRCDHYGQVEYEAELEAAKTSEAELKLRAEKAASEEQAEASAESAEAVEASAE
ncbi:MAG: hypothetical protein Kow00105_17750 [Phycisphaeraceae bacterium]